MEYLSEVTKIIDYGLNSDQNKLISQVKILIDNLRKDGDLFSADALEQALKVTKKSIKYFDNMLQIDYFRKEANQALYLVER